MKKGFTLMEILAVLLVLAVILSIAAPVFRAIRFDIRHYKAKVAVKKLAEAARTYYQANRGGVHSNLTAMCFTPTTTDGAAMISQDSTNCTSSRAATGIPPKSHTWFTSFNPSPLFACGYLSYKDFANLPYTFCLGKPNSFSDPADRLGDIRAVAYGASQAAGTKYYGEPLPGYIYIDERMQVLDTYED